jgi:hypothetical protein
MDPDATQPGTDPTLVGGPVVPTPGEPPTEPPEHHRRRWAVVLAVALAIVLVVVLLAALRNRREDRAVRSGESATATSAGSAAPTTAPAEAENNGGSGDGGESDGGAGPLRAPTIAGVDVACEQIVPIDRPPCSVTVRWVDNATDESGYRVEVASRISGNIRLDMAPDSTIYNRLFELDDSICVTVVARRGEETAASSEECASTVLN